jgi:hypothetical protein
MDTKQILIFAVAFIIVAIRLYMKYMKKNDNKTGTGIKPSGTSFPSSQKDEDYEPYSKK